MPTVGDYYQILMQCSADAYARISGQGRSSLRPADIHFHCIDYAHGDNSVLYHGTVSDLDGVMKATWSYEEQGEKVCREFAIDRVVFEALWDGLIDLAVIRRNVAKDMTAIVNLFTHHVIGAYWHEGAIPGMFVALVPQDHQDADFVTWLHHLNVPNGKGG
jgi:hypothetical protein